VKNAAIGGPGRVTRPGDYNVVGGNVAGGSVTGSGRPGGGTSSVGRPGGPVRNDPRYSRPTTTVVRTVYGRPRPAVMTYRGWYTGYYCHPWYRWQYSTVAVVGFGWNPYPWYNTWVPPYRAGWGWNAGYWGAGYWYPGYWTPVAPMPVGYSYVPGWWENDSYVEGYYRTDSRDGWSWFDGYYLEDGQYVRGHWEPDGDAPEGYAWEPGFWDGNEYQDGFWRPEFLDGYTWLSSYYDEDGVYRAGYWMPLQAKPGSQWIPGWFDGTEWVAGYWISDAEANAEDVAAWAAPEGVSDGWDTPESFEAVSEGGSESEGPPEARIIEDRTRRDGQKPIAVPVVVPREGQ
jgi:hypothetical protein